MTPKEKAKELIGKYVFLTVTDFLDENFEQTKQCALIAVDQIINALPIEFKNPSERAMYYLKVKQEIEKL